ncbi:14552_t:CDS:2 [Dentiscutata erythropus]|uniref:14552_t:CDS:1 n=1 Tax=Dentiscutata erythropus TaxID=1348616 RepID=A0A9N8WLU0_9GLOM|nr:14552_t:CDS:2 [Dentiscutata erythropus]
MVKYLSLQEKKAQFCPKLSSKYDHLVLSMPRRMLVVTHALTWPKIYAGCSEEFDLDGNNMTTHGRLTQALSGFKSKNFIICLDEIHEMMEHYRSHIVCLSATPIPIPIPNGKLISLKKSRTVHEVVDLSTCIRLHDTSASSLNRKCQVISGRNDVIKEGTEIIFGTNVWNV